MTDAMHSALFRFYEELNDFLPDHRRKRTFSHGFRGRPSVKDAVEALGVPHTEIDLILVDGVSVGFAHQLRGGERVAVYPVFERFDIAEVTRLRPRPLRRPAFIVDANLGKLARYLRMLGFDTDYARVETDTEIVAASRREGRWILTRDKGLLKHKAATHGHWVRATDPMAQVTEVVQALHLGRGCRPFSRCMRCNGLLQEISKKTVVRRLPPKVREAYQLFSKCLQCDKIYWPGTHFQRMNELVRRWRLP